MPDADLDLTVEGALFSGFGTAGQRHVARHRDRPRDRPRRSVARFAKAVEDAPIGDLTADVLYGRC